MEQILETLAFLQRAVQSAVASTSPALSSEDFVPPTKPVQLNDYVHVIHDPLPDRRPSVEIVFFHGLQFETTQWTYLNTWLSKDGTQLWLNWILNEFPDARILVISYDASFKRTDSDGIAEMFITGENLVTSLVDAEIGQDGCPVLLVGHCVGGLVMKEICIQARRVLPGHLSYKRVQNFLNNVKGLFFYATPNHGTEVAKSSTQFAKGPLVESLSILNKDAARQNQEFSMLRKEYGWKAFGVAEGREVSLGAFKGYFVEEASARSDVDTYYTVAANHFDVCRPESQKSSSFRLLVDFVREMVEETGQFFRYHLFLGKHPEMAARSGLQGHPNCSTIKDKVRHDPKIVISEEVIGIRSQTNVVKSLLNREQRVGIIGVGGIGKTTLARALYTAISTNFEFACFLEDVKSFMAEDEKADHLRTKIIENLYWRGRKVDSNFKWSFLKGKKVLVVLDGVTSASQVLVMTKSDEFSQDSRLVVTAREGIFLRGREKFVFHFAQTLNSKDSQRLFCLHAFETDGVPCEYEENVERLTKKCGGLPLALKVAGRYLFEREYLWDDVLENLDRAQPLDGNVEDDVWSILSMSYNSLVPAEKEMFLDVATVLHGKQLHEVKQMWKACGWRAESGWSNLLDKGLVTKVSEERIYEPDGMRIGGTFYYDERDGDRTYTIQMHDMLRDLGRSKACPGPTNFSDHSRIICEAADLVQARSFNQGVGEEKSKVEVLQVYGSRSSPANIDALHGMDNLRILLLEGRYADPDTTFPARFSGARDLFPSSLVYLSIKDTGHKRSCIEFGSEQASCRNVQQRQGLRCLDILSCPQLQSLPTFVGQLHCLEHLMIAKCPNLETLPDSLGNLRALQELRINSCGRLKALPDSLGGMTSLQELALSRCESLKYLPVSSGRLLSLRYLKIEHCVKLKHLPNFLWQLKALERLDLRYQLPVDLPLSFSFSGTLGKLQALQHLYISNANFSAPPEALGQLRGLASLCIVSCDSLSSLPDTLGDLKGLKRLTLSECVKLETLPNSVGDLKALRHLELSECVKLETLPNSVGNLKALRHLELAACYALKSLPTTLGELRALEHLDVSVCGAIRLPDIFKQLQALKHLTLDDVRSIPDSIGELAALRHLKLRMHCYYFRGTFPDSLGRLRDLKYLDIDIAEGGTLQFLDHLRNLEELRISAEYLEALPDSLGKLQALRRLELVNCYRLTALPETLGQLRSLEELRLDSCEGLCALPETMGKLESLRTLKITGALNLVAVPASLAQCESLERIDITSSLRSLFPDSRLPIFEN